jgi:hypothetical protein
MVMPKLVDSAVNWADEFDVYGFHIFSDEDWKEYLSFLDDITYPRERYFGTNESVEFSSKEEYLQQLRITDISKDEEVVLRRFFPYGFGKFFWLDG